MTGRDERVAIDRFLAALDGSTESERALPIVLRYCARTGARAEIVAGVSGTLAQERVERLQRQCGDGATSVDVVAPDQLGLELSRRVGDPSTALIVLSGHAPGRTAGVLTGSAAAEVLAAGRSVVFVGPRADAPPTDLPVVTLIDTSLAAAHAIPMGAALARSLRVPLEIVMVTRPTLGPPLAAPVVLDDLDAVVRRATNAAMATWPTLEVRGRVVSYPWRLPDAVDLYLRRHPGQLVTVATHIRSGLDRVVTPSTAMMLVRELSVPVLVVPVGAVAGVAPAQEPERGVAEERPQEPHAAPVRVVFVPADPALSTDVSLAIGEKLARAFGAELRSVAPSDDSGPSTAVVDAATAGEDSFICVATAARPHIDGLVTTAAGRIIRWSPRPVVLVGPHCSRPAADFREVVACVDGSLISESVAELAASWASVLRLPVRVLSVTDPDATPHGAASIAESYVARLAARLTQRHGVESRAETVEHATPAAGIRHWASTHVRRLFVMATHGHGLSEQLTGSAVLDVAHHVTTPVVVLPAHPGGDGQRASVTDDSEWPPWAVEPARP